MFERENLSGSNFNDWFRSPKMVLRVEKKLFVIEQPISPALPIDSTAQVLAQWNAVYDAHNEVSCLMLGSTTPELHGQLKNSLPYEMLQELKSMFNNKKSLNAKGKGKGKGQGKDKSYIPKPKNPKPYAKKHPTKDDAGNHCKEVGYCKRNYPAYLAELIKKKKQVGTASFSVIFTIELFSFPNKS
ncbi:hypothetical protein Tco_0190691 [Tanacetum coccineum]